MAEDNNPPSEIRKACMLLGLSPDKLSAAAVNDSWNKLTSHEKDKEIAIHLNTAKEVILAWLNAQQTSCK